jgi:type I restriction enzyme S subunit
MIEQNKIPKHWKIAIVKDVAENIQYGYTESSSKENVGPKFLRITDIQESKVDWENVPTCKIENEAKKKYQLADGDLLFARTGATVGKSFLIKGKIPDAVFASYLIRLRFPKTSYDKYVYYFFQSPFYWQQISEGQVGIGQPNVNGTKLGQLKIPLPPLPEQQLIVSKIEELLSDLENGKQQLVTAQQQLKVYRQSLLKYAFEGKLTNKNVNGELPKGWKWKVLSDVAKRNPTKATPSEFPDAKFIGMDCIEPNTMKPTKFYKFSEFKSAGNYFEKDQVLYGRMRPYLNKVYKAEFEGACSGEFIILQCTEDFSPDLLKYILHSQEFVKFANAKTSGDRPRISYEEISDYPVAVAPIKEQQLIVDELESKLTVCDKIEETISNSLQQAEMLKQSILKKAFEGKLI